MAIPPQDSQDGSLIGYSKALFQIFSIVSLLIRRRKVNRWQSESKIWNRSGCRTRRMGYGKGSYTV